MQHTLSLRRLFCAALLCACCLAASAQSYVSVNLNLRSKPSTVSGSLTIIPRGAAITIDVNGGDDTWVPVSYGGRRGYIQRRYVCAAPPPPRHAHHCKKCDKRRKHDNGKHRGHYKPKHKDKHKGHRH